MWQFYYANQKGRQQRPRWQKNGRKSGRKGGVAIAMAGCRQKIEAKPK
jgi:hypothetical protein